MEYKEKFFRDLKNELKGYKVNWFNYIDNTNNYTMYRYNI